MSPEPFAPHWAQVPGATIDQVLRVDSVDAALAALAEDPSRRPVAGGTDLVVDLDRTAGPPVELVDLSGIGGRFAEIEDAAGHLRIGGGVTHNEVVVHAGVIEHALPLAQACLEIGSPQLRNRATIAGNLATASPANDSISALMALDASLDLAHAIDGAIHHRSVAVSDFFLGVRATVLAPGELIVGIRVPKLVAPRRGVWVKLGLRRAQAISVVHAGLVVETDDARGEVVDARITLGSVAPTVVLAEEAARNLVGRPLDDVAIAEAASAAAASVTPIDDGRATAEYRRTSIETVVRRGLNALAAGSQAERWPARVPTLGPMTRRHAGPAALNDESEIAVTVNGAEVAGGRSASATLLDWLRDNAGTGTKEGCAEGECGACTVTLDGAAVMSCLTPAAQAHSASVTTVEGIATSGLSAVQQQFVEKFAVQCGYCIPGFIVSVTALLDEIPDPTREEIEFALAGNLCRCTGYYSIIDAVSALAAGQ